MLDYYYSILSIFNFVFLESKFYIFHTIIIIIIYLCAAVFYLKIYTK
jgi:hypothetical protein